MSGQPAPPAEEPGWTRWLPALLVPVALVYDLSAGLPIRSYFFRDFTVTFLPLRLFAAEELRALRVPFWNPYVFEGTFQLPSLYPGDLLQALWPSPVFVSWLLTLHLVLAALGAYWLARELGAARLGAFAAGAAFALGGFALSCLNLYVFLQGLALAPFVVGWLRRAALAGGAARVFAAGVLAAAISTLAVEFVVQAVALGIALGYLEARARGLRRAALAVLLGAGLAAVPVAVVLGLLPQTARGAGFAREVALGNAVHPVVLLQALLPHLFGAAAAPAEAWWGGRFFSKGIPYFLSLYLGPLALGLAAVGLVRLRRGMRLTLVAFSLLGLWYALGERALLASWLHELPLSSSFRFPSKALLLPYLGVTLFVGFGADRLSEGARAFGRLAGATCAAATIGLAVAAALWWGPPELVAWSGVREEFWPALVGVVARDALMGLLLAAGAVALALVVRGGWVRPRTAAVALIALMVADLARAGAGMNRQVDASFYDLVPELAALPLRDPDGGRLFSYGLDHSPAFRRLLSRGGPTLTLAGFFISRQLLAPYTNVLDRVSSPEGKDLTAFAPRAPELRPEDYDPAQVNRLLPWLRNAAVSRVLSVDPLADPALVPLGDATMGAPGIAVHAYLVKSAWPRAYVACRAVDERDPEAALVRPYAAGFDPRAEVALAAPDAPGCRSGRARALSAPPGRERLQVVADGAGYLVLRVSYARGWRARVDGRPAAVLRANGKHMAVRIPAGRHEVALAYHPPGLGVGLGASGLSALACLLLLSVGRRGARGERMAKLDPTQEARSRS